LLACRKGHLETVELLLKHNATINLKNTYGESALHIVVSSGNLPIVEVLLKAGADPNAKISLAKRL
jgi:ankyrin repeat protein